MIDGLGRYIPTTYTMFYLHFEKGYLNGDDSSGKGNHFYENWEGQNIPSPAVGKFGQCVEFHSANEEWLSCVNNTGFAPYYTVNLWIYPTAFPASGGYGGIVVFWNNWIQNYIQLYTTNESGRTSICAMQYDSEINQHIIKYYTSTLRRWYNVCMTWNGNTLCLYVDGNLIGTNYITSFLTAGGGWMYRLFLGKGGWTSQTGLNFDGRMDELIVDYRAWSPSEVALHYRLTNRPYSSRDRIVWQHRKLYSIPQLQNSNFFRFF